MFKNIVPFRLSQPDLISMENESHRDYINSRILELAHVKCTENQAMSIGFTSTHKNNDGEPEFIYSAMGWHMVAVMSETRTVPAAAVAEELAKKVEQIEADQGRKIYKKERQQLKFDAEVALLPRAFARRAKTPMLINQSLGLVLAATTSRSRAEDALRMLREAMGSLPVVPLTFTHRPAEIFYGWLSDPERQPHSVYIGYESSFVGKDKAAVKFKNFESDRAQVSQCVADAMTCQSIALVFAADGEAVEDGDEPIGTRAVLTDDLSLKRIKLDDLMFDKATTEDEERSIFDSNFVIETAELARIYKIIGEAMGGAEQ